MYTRSFNASRNSAIPLSFIHSGVICATYSLSSSPNVSQNSSTPSVIGICSYTSTAESTGSVVWSVWPAWFICVSLWLCAVLSPPKHNAAAFNISPAASTTLAIFVFFLFSIIRSLLSVSDFPDTIVDAAVIPKVFLSDTASTNVFAYKNLFSHPIVSSVPSSHAISQSLLDATAAAHTSGFHHQIIIQRLLITDQIWSLCW